MSALARSRVAFAAVTISVVASISLPWRGLTAEGATQNFNPVAQTQPNAKAAVAETKSAGKGRVVILGFDGVEPTIAQSMLDKGELPSLDKLRKKGTFSPLQTANPPQSPTAWSSFTTCKNPGNHGIYDFLRRTPKNYLPGLGFGTGYHAKLNADGSVNTPAYFESIRKGDSFWSVADKQGEACKILMVPFAYPADDLTQGCMLCGLGVPDIRNTTSTFFSFSDEYKSQDSVAGGIQMPLIFDGNKAKNTIPGARNPLVKASNAPGGYVDAPIEFTVDRAAHNVEIKLPSETLKLAQGQWSKWVEWTFQVTPQFSVKAVSQFQVPEVAEHVRIYMSCLQFHPKAPYMRMSTPESYAGELADRYGLYKTVGWNFDTHALRQNAIYEDAFLEDINRTSEWQDHLCLDELNRGKFNLLVAAWTAPDRVSHMFWRFRDTKHPLYTADGAKKYGHAVENTYIKMDHIVGEVMAKLQPNDLLMILSDHGFHSFRTGFNVNTWLIRNGYLSIKGQISASTAVNHEEFLQGYDWSQTKAYSIGLGSIFLNLKGREGEGTVDPAEAGALIAEIKSKLLAVTDPSTGDKVFHALYTRDDFKGISSADAPDIQLGYADGYQSTKDSVKGSAPKELFEPNDDKWSGEHAASDVANTPGIFFCNRPIADKNPAIIDLGVTALKYMGLNVPPDFEGKPLF